MKKNVLLKVSASISVCAQLATFAVEEYLGWLNILCLVVMSFIILRMTRTKPEYTENWKNFQVNMRWWLLGTTGWSILLLAWAFYAFIQLHK